MAAGRLPKPGTKLGPCKDECKHIDCKKTREMAWSICKYCGIVIDYEKRFYILPTPDPQRVELVHAVCHEDAIESEQIPD